MRRSELLTAVATVLRSLRESGVYPTLATLSSDRDVTRILQALNAFSIDASRFDAATHEVLKAVRLDALLSPDQWGALIGEKRTEGATWSHHIRYAVRTLELVLELLPRESDRLMQLGSPVAASRKVRGAGGHEATPGQAISIILPEAKGKFSRPERLIQVLEAVTGIYSSLAEMERQPTDTLVVVGCDSGSDKAFDFLGVAKLVEETKKLILMLWDRIVFYRERQLEARIKLVADSLPIFEQLALLQQNGQLGPEKAEIIRRNLHSSVVKFIESGATIPEMKDQSGYDPVKLMSPSPKLLPGPPPLVPAEKEPEPAPPPLTHEQYKVLQELLKQSEASEQHGSNPEGQVERSDDA